MRTNDSTCVVNRAVIIAAFVTTGLWCTAALAAPARDDATAQALTTLRSRIVMAVLDGRKVSTHVRLGGSPVRGTIVRCDAEQIVVKTSAIELPLAWSAYDEVETANTARGLVGDDDGEALLALVTVYAAHGRNESAREAFGRLAATDEKDLVEAGRELLDAARDAKNGTAASGKEAAARPSSPSAKVPLWSPEAAQWIAGGRNFFVSPKGTPSGNGSRSSPWDLRSVLEGDRGVRGGDVVWVMDGTYTGCFSVDVSGSEGRPVVIRAFPGARAVLDSADRTGAQHALEIGKSWCVVWGLEVMNSDPTSTDKRPGGYWFTGANSRMINCHVHDVGCCGYWKGAVDSEIYGCLLYNIGGQRKGRGQGNGHNMYTQNDKGTKLIRDNFVFNGFRNGIDGYTTRGPLKGFDCIGNTCFGSAASANEGGHKMDILFGGLTPASRILLKENLCWSNGLGRCVQLGYGSNDNEDVTLIDNYVAGRVDFTKRWKKIEMKGNKFFGTVRGNVNTDEHPDNYYGPPPKTTEAFVRPNVYEPGRANITVFNWSKAALVAVDISEVVPVGAEFEVRNGQNYNKGPVVKGTYEGGAVRLPMNGMDPVQPIGAEGYITKGEMTGSGFNIFVIQSWTPGTRGSE